jgi:hypothetical protein
MQQETDKAPTRQNTGKFSPQKREYRRDQIPIGGSVTVSGRSDIESRYWYASENREYPEIEAEYFPC